MSELREGFVNTQVQWPVIIFDREHLSEPVQSSEDIYSVREPPYLDELLVSFDSLFRIVEIRAVSAFDYEVSLQSTTPREREFRIQARIAWRLYGPDSQWRRCYLQKGDGTDTTEWSIQQLRDAITTRFGAG